MNIDKVSDVESTSVLVGLRLLQDQIAGDVASLRRRFPQLDGISIPSAAEIDDLCKRLNCGRPTKPAAHAANVSAAVGSADLETGAGKDCPQYIPTEDEFRELARYWITEILESETGTFLAGDIGRHDLWVRTFGRQRLNDIAAIIGERAVKKIILQVENEFRRKLGDRRWHIFEHGTDAERNGIIEETHAGWDCPLLAPKYAVDYLAKERSTDGKVDHDEGN